MMVDKKKQIALIFAGITGAAIFLIMFLKLHYMIQGPCYISAHVEWSVVQPAPEILMTRLTFYNPLSVQELKLLQFDRSDFMNFSLNSTLRVGQEIQKGEVLGTIQSAENRIRFEELYGELNGAKANLDFLSTGQKASIQEEALQFEQYAAAELAAFDPILKRKKDLFIKNIISAEELELANAQYKLLALKVSIAQANVKTVQTGVKLEETNVVKKQISDIETRLKTIRQKMADMIITAPVSGTMMGSIQESGIVSICKIDTVVVQIPVEERKLKYARHVSPIRVYIPASPERIYEGRINSIDKYPQFINGNTMFITRTNFENKDNLLTQGMTGFARIYCDTISVATYFRRWWNESSGRLLFDIHSICF